MSYLTSPNEDAKTVAPEFASLGPRVGFLESWKTAWEAQVRTAAMDGMWAAFADEEDEQVRRLREAGIENIPRIAPELALPDISLIGPDADFGAYEDAAKYFAGRGDERTATRMNALDERLARLREERPDVEVLSPRDMYDRVVAKGRAAEQAESDQRRTFTGHVGGFLGGAVASMAPRTDFFNFVTMGVGGLGKTAISRIATQAGAQGVIETINQVTGVQEQRDMMGLSSGFGDAVSRVAGTALAGGALQGVGEGLAFAGRRFFTSRAGDPAPEIPVETPADPETGPLLLEYRPAGREQPNEWEGQEAWESDVRAYQEQIVQDLRTGRRDYTDDIIPAARYGETRFGEARARADLEYVAERLNTWDAPNPYELAPPKRSPGADTSMYDLSEPKISGVDEAVKRASIDAQARDVDPQLFHQYDKLSDRANELRRWLEDPRYKEAQSQAVTDALAEIEELTTRIDNLKWNKRNKGRVRREAIQAEIEELTRQKAKAQERAFVRDTSPMAAIRQELIKTDEKMRDLAPAISRAYAQARGVWDLDEPNRALVRQMTAEGRKHLGSDILPSTYEDMLSEFQTTLADRAPVLKRASQVQDKIREGMDASDVASLVIREDQKVLDDTILSFRESLDSISRMADDGVVTMNGERYKFDLDKDTIDVMMDDGNGIRTMTVRELLEDAAETEAELKATQTCSIL